MRKMETTSFKFKRLDLSPYQSPDFPELEKKSLANLNIEQTELLEEAQILISNTHTDFSKLPLDKLTHVKLLLHPNSGHDNIPCEFVTEAPFPIICGNSIRANGVTEYTLGRLFQHLSSLEDQPQWQPGRAWPRQRLADKNILILGRGTIGKLLISSLTPLARTVSSYDPFKGDSNLKLDSIDVVLVAASLNQTSEGMINSDFLSKLNPGWLLINGARGKIINQKDLIEALNKDSKAFAYLDVFEKEPFEASAFNGILNIFRSSHLAGVSTNLDQLIIDFEVQAISDFLTQCLNLQEFENKYEHLLLKNKLSPDKSFLI